MTEHIKNEIERILFNGGFVVTELKKFIDILENIRSVESIFFEFSESFKDIEKRKGTIPQKDKEDVFKYIHCTEKYKS